MKRKLLLSGLFVVLAAGISFAQPRPVRPMFSIGAEFAFPDKAGSFGNEFSMGFGGSGKFEVPFTASLYGTANAGFVSFYRKKNLNGTRGSNKSYVPLKAGLKYYFNRSLFVSGEVGASIGIQKNAGVAFAWAPEAGFMIPLTERHAVSVGLRYERWARIGGNINQTGLRVAYQF